MKKHLKQFVYPLEHFCVAQGERVPQFENFY